MPRNYAALPYDYLEEMALLSDEEFGRVCRALLRYSRDGICPELPGNERLVFPRVMMQEDRFRTSYDNISSSRSESGKKGAAARWQSDSKNSKCHFANGKNDYTDTDTDTNTNTPPPNGGRSKAQKHPAPNPNELKVQWAENVSMTNAQHEKLLAAHGPADTARLIEILDNYKGSTGKRYKDDYRAILSWCVDRLRKDKVQPGSAQRPPNFNAPVPDSGAEQRVREDLERMRAYMRENRDDP